MWYKADMGSLERRYAEALLSLSDNTRQADLLGSALGALGRIYVQNAEFRELILNPEVSRQTRCEIFLGTLIKLGYIDGDAITERRGGRAVRLDAETDMVTDAGVMLLKFLQMLLDKGRLAFLPFIADEYYLVKARHRQAINIIARSPEPLDSAALDDLRYKYMAQYGAAKAEIENIVEPSQLGGVSIQIGDMRVDETLYGRLAALARAIASGAVKQTAGAG